MNYATNIIDKATDTFLAALDSVLGYPPKSYERQINMLTKKVHNTSGKEQTKSTPVIQVFTKESKAMDVSSIDSEFVQGGVSELKGEYAVRGTGAVLAGQNPYVLSPFDAVESARKGVAFNEFKSVYDLLKLPTKKWAEIIGVSEKTMQNIIKDKRFLDQNKSEKLLNFLLLVKYGLEVIGAKDLFENWLRYNSPMLNGNAPIDYVDTIQGINMLKELLFKIESGNLI